MILFGITFFDFPMPPVETGDRELILSAKMGLGEPAQGPAPDDPPPALLERLFFDLKVVLKLERFHAANPNAVAMQVFAGAIVHADFRIAQADLAKKVGLSPEELSTQKLFPLLALASIKVIEAEFFFEVTCKVNKGVKLRKPSWRNIPDTVVSLDYIRVQRRSEMWKKRKFDPKRRNWKSFNKVRGGRKLT